MTLPREHQIPDGATPVTREGVAAVAYSYTARNGKPAALGFSGKRQKPDFRYYFGDEERRDRYVSEWFDDRAKVEAMRRERQDKRKAFQHTLKVGDVLVNSWGYDQTNIDYFEVTAVVGKRMVEIREIGSQSNETLFMQGDSVPAPGHYIGEPMRKLVQEGNAVKIHSWGSYARPLPYQEVAGTRVYAKSHWTAYA